MKFCVTIDVEPDCGPRWVYANPLSFRGVSEGIAGRLEPLFQRLGVKPTYMISNVVLEDAASVDILSGLKSGAELGAHLHPEFIEPEKRFSEYGGRRGLDNSCFLPPDIEAAKLANLTALYERRFGRRPVSFRAGRFSAGPNTFVALAKLGYKVDTSVTPHINWCDPTHEHPVDFSQAPEQPHWQGELLEVPVSIGVIRRFFRSHTVWLRPVYATPDRMRLLIDAFAKKYGAQVVLNMMFHNVEVLPNLSPYTANESECGRYLQSLEHTLSYMLKAGFESATLSEVYESRAGK